MLFIYYQVRHLLPVNSQSQEHVNNRTPSDQIQPETALGKFIISNNSIDRVLLSTSLKLYFFMVFLPSRISFSFLASQMMMSYRIVS